VVATVADPHVPDLAERRRALEAGVSFIVQAPAGSGKTELLIQRYLRLLACVEHPEEIVAVTFTRKAASEMRERVLQALAAARAGSVPQSEHERTTLSLAAAALQCDAAAGWCIADNPARLRIQTVDALCAALTRQMPMLSRFGSQPDSTEDADALYLEAARATIGMIGGTDPAAEHVARLLDHLDNDVGRVEGLLADMLRRRDHWLRLDRTRERGELEAALRHARRTALQRLCRLYPAACHDETLALARYAAGQLAVTGENSYPYDFKELIEFPEASDSHVSLWQGLAVLLLTQDGQWRKAFNKRQGFPAGVTKSEKEEARRWKDRAMRLVNTLASADALRVALDEIGRVPPPAFTDSQWELLGAIMHLLPRAVAHLKLVFQLHGQADFTEVAQGALRALGEPDAPTDLALALDYRIRHLLIDEFQDTSISQYELVARLTAGWEAGDGRTVFAVGDPMQSIYRFREAEVGLFLRARGSGIGGVALQPLRLSANFRSQAGIVEWVNGTFARMMPAHEDVAAGAVPYTPSIATRDALPGAAVSVHPFFENDHGAEAERVTAVALAARRSFPQDRTAILVRGRGHLREIVPRLRAAGLKFRAIEIEGLAHRPVVQDLLALTRALSHPADRTAWLAVLRAPWCGLVLADLHVLAGTDGTPAPVTVWEAMNDDGVFAALSADGQARLDRARDVLGAALVRRNRGTLRERVAGVWYALGGPACVADPTDLEDAEIYLDYVAGREEAGALADLSMFEEGLEKLYALPDLDADESLQVMTIHKAKGLEFDTVIVPGLGRPPARDGNRLMLWMEQPRADGRASDLLLAPIHETGGEDDPIYLWLQKLDAEKESFERERLLYVAATRARNRLHLLGSIRLAADDAGVREPVPPAARTLLYKLWPAVAAVYVQAASDAPAAPSAPENNPAGIIDQSLRRLVSGWTLPAAPPAAAWRQPPDLAPARDAIEFSWAGETARHVGSVVHRWLQRIAEDGLQSWNVQRLLDLGTVFCDQLAAQGVPADELAAAGERVAQALAQTVADARGRWLLGPQADARNEYRLASLVDGRTMHLVIDRLFRAPDGVQWIVDYKTSTHEGAGVEAFLDREQERYRPQLERYARALGGAADVALGLYFPLLGGWREWRLPPV